MIYLGDFPADQAIYFMWNTSDSDGASITRSTDGTISVYKDASNGTAFDTTQVTTGVTNDEDFDGLTGMHTCCITTTNAWYEIGHDYSVVLSASTIDTQIVNVVIAHFSIENRNMRGTDSAATAAALTTHDGKLDTVDANVDSVLVDTAVIGVLGVGLTAIPWNSDWDAEVQSECADALTAYDPPTRTEATTDKNSIITEVNANETKIDTIDANVDSILVDTGTTLDGKLNTIDSNVDSILVDTGTTLNDMLKRSLGLQQENQCLDNTVFTGGYMTSCRLRLYSVAGSVGTASDVIATYTITATYSGNDMSSYKVVKV